MFKGLGREPEKSKIIPCHKAPTVSRAVRIILLLVWNNCIRFWAERVGLGLE